MMWISEDNLCGGTEEQARKIARVLQDKGFNVEYGKGITYDKENDALTNAFYDAVDKVLGDRKE